MAHKQPAYLWDYDTIYRVIKSYLPEGIWLDEDGIFENKKCLNEHAMLRRFNLEELADTVQTLGMLYAPSKHSKTPSNRIKLLVEHFDERYVTNGHVIIACMIMGFRAKKVQRLKGDVYMYMDFKVKHERQIYGLKWGS